MGYMGIFRVFGFRIFLPITDNQMGKENDNEMEAGIMRWCIRFLFSKKAIYRVA